jgi:uncharacterized membrane protein YkvI
MLKQMDLQAFHLAFQLMIFAALLESGTGLVHAVNERIATGCRRRLLRELPRVVRLGIAGALLTGSIFMADRFGLVTLIAKGYRIVAYAMLLLYALPLMTYGIWCLWKSPRTAWDGLMNH